MQPIKCNISYKSKKTNKDEETTILLATVPNLGDIIIIEDEEITENRYKTTLEVIKVTHHSSEEPTVIYHCKNNTKGEVLTKKPGFG